MINVRCVQDGYVDMSSARAANTELATGKWKHFQVDAGDILFTISGTIGRCAIVQDTDLPLLMNTSVVRFRPTVPELDQKFLYLFLQSEGFQAPLKKLSSGTAIRNVGPTHIKTLSIPLPPLEEQQRIVAVLDEAFEGLARARAHAEANLQNARELFPSCIAEIFSTTDSWNKCPVADIGEVFDGPHATPKTVDQGPLFLGISSLVDGRIELEKTRHVTEDDFAKWTRRVEPQQGDVVFSYETRLGQVGLIPDGMRCCLGRRMGLVRLDESKISPDFFVAYYLSPFFQDFLRNNTVKGATVDRISIKDFPKFPVLLPPKDVQRAVIDQIASLRDVHDSLIKQATTKLQDLDDLRQSLLQKAFAGELT